MLLDVRAWLEAEGFGRFADLFESRQIDGDALVLLTDAHLREIGLPLGPRVKLLKAIERLAAGAAPSAERRRLTVMFVDLVGSTALSTRHDPEDVREVLRGYQQAIAGEVARYEAHLARYMGDAALVYFGYPKAHEDDAERAVRAALAIVEAVAALRSPGGEPLAAHIGIATGLVVVGDLLVGADAQERTVVGDTPNIAARLQSLAGPGEIVVSGQTRALTGGLFEWRDLGPQTLRGVPEPVVACRALRERAVATRFEARAGSGAVAMVGREPELALLQRGWRRAVEGNGGLVVVTGEAGIGKSRLLRALEEAIAGEPHIRITNQCSPYHAESALHPMIRQLSGAAGLQAGQALDEQLDRVEALLPAGEALDNALVASLLGIDGTPRYGKVRLTPEQQRARTFETLLTQLVRLSARAPIFWVLEDAHWADPTTLEMVAMCTRRLSGARILAVVTTRPERADDFGEPVMRLRLERLARAEAASLVGQIAQGKALPAAVRDEIVHKTDGVPLFVEELTKMVLESGLVEGVPASLHDSMMARLDRHAALKEVAQTAACIGREFGHELLTAVSSMPPEAMREGLQRLEEAELVYRRRGTQPIQYVFKHALVRDAAYESLLKSRRQEIHGRIVKALEAQREAAPELLAVHSMEAGLVEKSIGYWEKAGKAAIARPAYREATSHINQALRLAGQMGEERTWQERRLQLLLLLGQATIPLRGYSHSETMSVFAQAQSLIARIGEDAPHRFSVSYATWVGSYVRGEHARALAVAADMRDRAQRDRSDGRMLSALRALGIGQMITGELAAAQSTFEIAQKLAYVLQRQSREQRIAVAHRFAADPEIATQFHVALTLWALGHVKGSRELVAQTLAAARAMGHVHTLGHALAHAAIFAAVMRDREALRALSEETVAFATEHDMDLWRGYGSILLGYALVLGGQTQSAVSVMASGFAHLQRTETGTMVPAYHAVQAYALAALGRFGEAQREAAIVERELATGCERYFWPEALRWLGDYRRLLPGAGATAPEEAYAQALSVARAQQARSFELGAATSLARHWAERGERERALALVAPLHASLREGLDTPVAQEAAALLLVLRAEKPQAAPKLIPLS